MYSYDYREAARGKTFYHGSSTPTITSFRASESDFGLLGTGVYFYAKANVAKQYYGPHVYKVSVPSSLKLWAENEEFDLQDVKELSKDLGLDPPVSLGSLPSGVTKPLWWFTDAANYFDLGRREVAADVSKHIQSKGFSGMLTVYPKGGKVLVLWKGYEKLKPQLVE